MGKTEKVNFWLGSVSRDFQIVEVECVCERPLTIGYSTDRWMNEDSAIKIIRQISSI